MRSSSFANIISGSLLALVNISVAVSVAALLFAQTDSRLMVPGIAILLMGTLVTGLGGSLFSDHKAVICSPGFLKQNLLVTGYELPIIVSLPRSKVAELIAVEVELRTMGYARPDPKVIRSNGFRGGYDRTLIEASYQVQ